MTKPTLLSITGSPSADSRSTRLLRTLTERLRQRGGVVHEFSVQAFDPAALLRGDVEHPSIRPFVELSGQVDAVLLSTPVYKAAYTGGLKAVVDLVPYEAWVGKLGFGLATARRREHVTQALGAFERLFGFFRVGTIVPGLGLLDDEIFTEPAAQHLSESTLAQLDERVHALAQLLGLG